LLPTLSRPRSRQLISRQRADPVFVAISLAKWTRVTQGAIKLGVRNQRLPSALKPRRPQLVRIALLLGLVARQRHQPSLGFWRDRRLLAGSRSVIKRPHRTIGHRPLDAALDRLMVDPKPASDRKERQLLTIHEQHPRPLDPARRLSSRARNGGQPCNLLVGHRQVDRMPPSCHDATPHSPNRKRGIREQSTGSMTGFMESVV
jgi:hypothetical protein